MQGIEQKAVLRCKPLGLGVGNAPGLDMARYEKGLDVHARHAAPVAVDVEEAIAEVGLVGSRGGDDGALTSLRQVVHDRVDDGLLAARSLYAALEQAYRLGEQVVPALGGDCLKHVF